MSVLLDAAIKVSIIVLVGLAAARLMPRRSAAERHWILAAAIACAAISPLLGSVVPSWRVDLGIDSHASTSVRDAAPIVRDNGSPALNEEVQTTMAVHVADPSSARGTTSVELLILLWMAGSAIALGLLIACVARLRWLESRCAPLVHGAWVETATDLALEYRLRRPPIVLQSDRPGLLVTWGLRESRVIVPAAADSWTVDRIRVALAHELAHILRRDWLLQMAAETVRCVYWFNPIVWAACRRLRQESEQACDDAVLKRGIDGQTYATHLLEIARTFQGHRHVWSSAPAIAHPSSLERRVRAMLNDTVNREPATPLVALAAAAALLCITIPVAGLDAFAQTRFATVSGTATDETGAVLANATLVLSNVQTNAKNEVRTNQSGFFDFVGLPAGQYQLEVTLLGFEPFRDGVSVGVGETLQKNVALRVGTVQEVITVTHDRGKPAAASPGNRVQTAPAPNRKPCPNPAVGGCIGPPVKLKDVRPLYPPGLSESDIQGTVQIEGQIGIDGKMTDMRVTSSPHPAFERSALDAVGEWEFTPTTLNGRAIDTRIRVNISFAQGPGPATPPPAPPR
jgi:TonB family protein